MPASLQKETSLSVQNIGGIDETEVSFTPGVTVLTGRNATNRTSFLQSIMAACGSDEISMKADADEASVELHVGEETYSRTFERTYDSVITDGDPYLDDPTVADLFAFLLESNEARTAVARGDDLRDIIMRPIDTEEIRAEIDRLLEERRDIDEKLDEIERLGKRLPELEQRRTQLREDIDEKQSELDETEAELEAAEVDVETRREERQELEAKLDDLRSKRSSLEDVRYELETERESLTALRQERNELQEERSDLPDAPMGDVDDIESRVRTLRERKQRLDAEINDLHNLVQFNEQMLDGDAQDVVDALEPDDGALTDQLLDADNVTCWTCGTEVEGSQIEGTLDRLRELSREKIEQRNDIEDELSTLREEQNELQRQQRQRERIDRRLDETDRQIEQRENDIERLQQRRDDLTDEIESLEGTVEDLEDDDAYSDLLEAHRQANQLEFDLGRLESDLDDVEDEIADIEDRLDEREPLQDRRETVADRIEELRTKVEEIESRAVERFNEHMDAVLETLDYDNIDRIWLEQFEQEVRRGRRKVTESTFELHIVRSTESGTTYEDTVDNLSESEREVTGLVFALAGYLVHDVHEKVPFMLLDSLEAIDSDRIAALVEYLEDYADHLVIALLPEDAAALDDDYQRITEI
jgi:DNA repair exonuclease SbcCD ATPase subunit